MRRLNRRVHESSTNHARITHECPSNLNQSPPNPPRIPLESHEILNYLIRFTLILSCWHSLSIDIGGLRLIREAQSRFRSEGTWDRWYELRLIVGFRLIYKFGFLGTVVLSQSFSHSSRGNEHRVKTHGLIRCFKIILARVSETKILHVAKKISAQPTARKKIEPPCRIGGVFKLLVFWGQNWDFKVNIAVSRWFHK